LGKIDSTIKSEIQRLAKREVRATLLPLKREARTMRISLSKLSRTFSTLQRFSRENMKEVKPKLAATPEEVKASRFTPGRIRNLRQKLGISQRELGILTEVTLGAVGSWEKGKFKPRGEKKAALVALRKLGKRDIKKILAEKAGAKGEAQGKKSEIRARRKHPGKKGMRKKNK